MANKSTKVIPALPRGMRDHLPEELVPRLKVVERIRRVFELYGFQPLETPAMERLEVLTGKSGEESDKLTFRVMKRGAEFDRALTKVVSEGGSSDELADLGLRYEFTVSLARVMAQYGDRLPKPFKRYQIGPVWRADRPQQGRYREFIQCDVDIVGTDSLLADAELVALMADLFLELAMDDVCIQVNHRGLLQAFNRACGNPPEQFAEFCAALDKADKLGMEGALKEMRERGLSVTKSAELTALARLESPIGGSKWDSLLAALEEIIAGDDEGLDAVGEVKELLGACSWLGVPTGKAVFKPTLARGLDYYTGPVFEAVSHTANVGSLGGGGRYDELIGVFSNQRIPATGTSFGLERITDVMLERGLLKSESGGGAATLILLTSDQRGLGYCGVVSRYLRQSGVSCELSYDQGAKPGRQIQTAVRRGSRFAIFIGSEELSSFDSEKIGGDDVGIAIEYLMINAKRLSDGVQRQLTLAEFVEWIKER